VTRRRARRERIRANRERRQGLRWFGAVLRTKLYYSQWRKEEMAQQQEWLSKTLQERCTILAADLRLPSPTIAFEVEP